jgi:hypothetical protein
MAAIARSVHPGQVSLGVTALPISQVSKPTLPFRKVHCSSSPFLVLILFRFSSYKKKRRQQQQQ